MLQHTHRDLSQANHLEFTDRKFKIRDHTGSKCLATPPTRELDPRIIEYHHHHSLFPIVFMDCDAMATNQLWHKAKHALVNLDTRLCMGVVFEPGQSEGKVVLQTCMDGYMDQVWYCSGHLIKDYFNSSCLFSGFPAGSKRRKREVQIDELPSDGGRNTSRPRRSAMEGVTLRACNSESPLFQWTFADPDATQGEDQGDFHRAVCSGDPYVPQRCYPADMRPATLAGEKHIRCNSPGYYVTGFTHTNDYEDISARYNHNKGLISAMSCCTDSISVPDPSQSEICTLIKWWEDSSNTVLISKGWVYCPRGMYMKGLILTTVPFKQTENVIDKIECCHAPTGELSYPDCYYDQTVEYIDSTNHGCREKGHYITAVIRTNCNYARMECNEILICCRLVN